MTATGRPDGKPHGADSFRRRRGIPGFTLIEPTIVILIIGLLAGIATYAYRGLVAKARMTQAKTVLTHLFRTEAIHYANNDRAIPKEGPSAGVTIALALISLLTGRPARRTVALSGEMTLNGRLLPVSGIREKLLAAQRSGVQTVIFPQGNAVDVRNLEGEVKEGLEIILAEAVGQVVEVALVS